MINELFTRVRFFFFRHKQAQLDEELQFHLEQASPGCFGSDSDSGACRHVDRPGGGLSLRIVADALKNSSALVTT